MANDHKNIHFWFSESLIFLTLGHSVSPEMLHKKLPGNVQKLKFSNFSFLFNELLERKTLQNGIKNYFNKNTSEGKGNVLVCRKFQVWTYL